MLVQVRKPFRIIEIKRVLTKQKIALREGQLVNAD